MPKVHNLRIRTKVAGAFGLVLAVTLALGLFAVDRMGLVHERAADVRDNWFPATRALGDYAFQTMRVRQMEAAVITAPPEAAADELRLLVKIAGDAQKAWARYERDLSDETRTLAERIAAGWESYLALDASLRAMRAAQASPEQLFAFYAGDMRRAYAEWRDILVQLIDLQMREGDRTFQAGEDAYASARIWIYGAIGLAVVLSGLAGLFLVLSISRPIRGLTLLMNRLATSDLSVTIEGAERRDEVGAMAKAVQVFRQGLIERDRLQAELQRLARIDPLTGALNRRAFREAIEREAARARRHGRPLSLAMIDVDHFKRVNDAMGHAMGDRFLVAVAEAVAAALRTEDLFGRYGGEEFVVAFAETDLAGAIQAAERLRLAIAAIRLKHDGVVWSITASLGVASFGDLRGDSGETVDSVINTADQALYQAKTAGRNRVLPYKP
ncbi:MAG TPA: diguanylate cyclase, partial [Caulobacteraceae bacterium]|nr:diguanylate cyclase [Caulobacteraceae bacterium]